MIYARVVLPVPGGPQKIIEGILPDCKNLLIGPLSPTRCSCPMNPSNEEGLYFDANGSYTDMYTPLYTFKRNMEYLNY